MKRILVALAIISLFIAPMPASARVDVTRHGDENPMVEIARSTMYGAMAGTLIGSAFWVAQDEKDGTPVKWGFVIGTFAGAAYGFYDVTSRPSASALLEWHDGRIGTSGLAALDRGPLGPRVRMVSTRF